MQLERMGILVGHSSMVWDDEGNGKCHQGIATVDSLILLCDVMDTGRIRLF